MCDCNCKACSRCESKGHESRESKAHERSEIGKSAFGVAHDTEVSKLALIQGIKTGAKALRFASPKAVGVAAKTGYGRSIASGNSKLKAGLRGFSSGVMRSPGTAAAIGAGGAGAVGGTGYMAGKIGN